MAVAVKWVYQANATHTGNHVQAGQKPSLCVRLKKHMLCVAAGHPVRVVVRPAADFDAYRTVVQDGMPYPVPAAAERLERIGHTNGLTVGASRLLEAVKQWMTDPDSLGRIDESEFNNEEEMNEMVKNETSTQPEAQTSAEGVATSAPATSAKAKGSKKAATKPAATKPGKMQRAILAATKPTDAKPAASKPAKAPKASNAKLPKRESKGETPFRAGTAKEKAYLAFKADAARVQAMDRDKRKEWATKLAGKLGVSPGTISSWVSGQFAKALSAAK